MKRQIHALALAFAFTVGAWAAPGQLSKAPGAPVDPVVPVSLVRNWDKTVDLCVVGYGLAGASTAIEAIDANPKAKILVLEKMPKEFAGGNSRASGQTILTPDVKDIEKFKTYMRACNEPNQIPEEYLDFMAKEMCTQLSWIQSVVEPVGYEVGYVGGGALRWVKVTEFAELPGSDFNATSAHIRTKGKGFEPAGVWNGFEKAVATRNIEVRYDSPVVALVQDPATKAIHGVIVRGKDGVLTTVKALKGVVLACGGYENNLEMERNFHGFDKVYTTGTPGNTGDGIQMLMAAGAKIWHMKNRTQSGGTWIGINTPDYEASFIRQMSMKSGSWIEIGRDGKRFYDEARDYHRQHMKYYEAGNLIDVKHWATLPSYMIFDENCRKAQTIVTTWLSWPIAVQGYQWSKDNSKEIEKGWIIKADSIEELGRKIGQDPVALKGTIDAWNASCAAGKDVEWNRDPKKMAKIEQGPFYAVSLAPALVATTGGAVRDTMSRVLDWQGKTIPHLYEAGELGSYVANLYQNGVFLAEAVLSGRAAAKDALTQPDLR